MKFRFYIIILFLLSCSTNYTSNNNKIAYNSKGFAYLYNDRDYSNKIIKKKLDNNLSLISHQDLRVGTLIKLINPKNNKSIILKNSMKIDYPDFYKILITKPVADKLEIKTDFPLIEIIEIKKNKSFIAEKAKIYSEEKKISANAPITDVEISNISKNIISQKKDKPPKMYISIATFYNEDSAMFLRKRIKKELSNFNFKKLIVKKNNDKEITLLSGPYNTINSLKNDYIKLKYFGFEEMDILTNE